VVFSISFYPTKGDQKLKQVKQQVLANPTTETTNMAKPKKVKCSKCTKTKLIRFCEPNRLYCTTKFLKVDLNKPRVCGFFKNK